MACADVYPKIANLSGFQIKWKKASIVAPGTYPTGGIVGDIFLFARAGEDILNAQGSVTFTTYVVLTELAGTFTLTATGLATTGSFVSPRRAPS